MATYVHEGTAIDYTPASDLPAGSVVVIGDLVGVARSDIAANKRGSLAVAGVFDFTKATGGGSAITAGTQVYWDAVNSQATASSGGGANKLIGKCVRDAADSDATVRVRLFQ